MALSSGLAAQLGVATETTYGIPVPVTRFLPLESESLMSERARLESAGIIAGKLVLLSQSWSTGNISAGGDIGFELYDRSLGILFNQMFGTTVTTGAGPYTHTFTPGNLYGKSMTVQVGVPGVNGTVQPFTYPGCKVDSWKMGCAAGEIATLGLTLIGRNEIAGSRVVTDGVTNSTTTVTSATGAFGEGDIGKPIAGTGIPANATIASITSATSIVLSAAATATGTAISLTIGVALATAAYTAGIKPLTFIGGSAVTVGGTAVQVTAAEISGTNNLKGDRRFIADRLIGEPVGAGLREYGGTLDFEFTDLTQHNRFTNGTEAALSLQFASGANSVTITANIRYDDAQAQVSGTDIVSQQVPFKCLASGSTDSTAITAVLVNSDVTA